MEISKYATLSNHSGRVTLVFRIGEVDAIVFYSIYSGTFRGHLKDGTLFKSNDSKHANEFWFKELVSFFEIARRKL